MRKSQTVSAPQSKKKSVMKTVGLGELWAIFEVIFYVLGGKISCILFFFIACAEKLHRFKYLIYTRIHTTESL